MAVKVSFAIDVRKLSSFDKGEAVELRPDGHITISGERDEFVFYFRKVGGVIGEVALVAKKN